MKSMSGNESGIVGVCNRVKSKLSTKAILSS